MTDTTASTARIGGRMGNFRAALAESPPLLWSFLYFFCLLSGYYVLRPVREAMGASSDVAAVFPPAMIEFFAVRGIELKELVLQVLFTCTFLIMLVLQPVYGWLVSRFPRRVFLPVVYGFFIATLLVFYAMFHGGVPGRGMAFFLWITVFNLFAVAVFWSFMADVYDDAEARRYYGYIGAAGTLGAIFGPMLTRTLVERIGIAKLHAGLGRVPAAVHRLPAAPAPACGAARAAAQPRQRRAADRRAGAGRAEAGGARTAAALDGGADPVRRRRRHPAVQRNGTDECGSSIPTRSWQRRTTRTSTWR